jgi:transcriptional regulator CtsR
MITQKQVSAAINTIKAIADAIRDLETVQSGVLYARVMNYLSLQEYEHVIQILVDGEIITKKNHELKWNMK